MLHHSHNETLKQSSWCENGRKDPKSLNLSVKSGDVICKFPHILEFDNCGEWTPISTCLTIHHSHNETLKQSSCCECEVKERTKSHSILVWKVEMSFANFPLHPWLKVSPWRPLWRMNSNFNLVWPLIIVIMRHWNSQAAVKGEARTKSHPILVFEKRRCHLQISPHPWLVSQPVATIVENEFQS